MGIKGSQLAMLVWMANLLILAGGGFMGYRVWTEMSGNREKAWDEASRPVIQQERINWSELFKTRTSNVSAFRDAKLSPTQRPTERRPVQRDDTPAPPPPEPTDEELKAEVQAWINETFSLRMLYGPRAFIDLKGTSLQSLQVWGGMTIKQLESDNIGAAEPKLAQLAKEEDITFVRVVVNLEGNPSDDHLLIRAPARNPKYKDRLFVVSLKMGNEVNREITREMLAGRPTGGPGGAGSIRGGPSQPRTPRESTVQGDDSDTPPPTQRTESTFDEATNTWTLGQQDYMDVDINELARHVRVAYDQTTNRPIGIQITDSLPANSLLRQRGAQPNDIIKSINGTPVTGAQQVIGIVRTQYNEGVRKFEVVFERGGVEQRMTFNAGG
jgi:hypothetical protein